MPTRTETGRRTRGPVRPRRPARPRRRSRKTLPKPVGLAIVVIAGVVLVSLFVLLAFRVLRHGSLPRVVVAGADVGALPDEQLRSALRDIAAERRGDGIVFRRPATGAAREATHETTGEDLGYTFDIERTAIRVLDRGRQSNPAVALFDQIHATFGAIEVEPVDSFLYDEDHSPVADVAASLSAPPFYGGVAHIDGDVKPRYPEPGVVVSEDDIVVAALPAMRAPGDDEVAVEGTTIEPQTARADVDTLVEQAERAVDGRVELTASGRSMTFRPADIGSLLRTEVVGTGDATELQLRIPTRGLMNLAGDRLRAMETRPVDATFEAVGDSVSIIPARPGFELVPQRAAEHLLQVALRRGSSTARLKGETRPAGFTTAEARSLDIKEQVSTFTTYHACCEPRVDNIHRIADIVDGAIVRPGESFSLNEYVGPRTTANGFVSAPAIRDGEFVEEVGGGISQFATTMFNAIFFGGYDFLEYQPHSYYISRYPPGREATISSPGPDLAFSNDSDAGIYIATSYTATSITVSFYGAQDFEVDAREGPRTKVRAPKTTCRVNESLAKGEERVVQEGLTGFDIVVTRVFSDGRPAETFSTHYDMQPRIVERRTCDEKKRKRKN